jgi:hypothetical protein
MRISYAVAVAAFLAGTPAMAQVIVSGGDHDSARHEAQADRDRAAGRQNMEAAHQEAAMGNYGAAARDQAAGRQDLHASHHQQRDADRDSHGGVVVQLGH